MIPIEKEPKELYKEFKVHEVCVFCRKPTAFWNLKTNNPVCEDCSKVHNESELKNYREKFSTIQ